MARYQLDSRTLPPQIQERLKTFLSERALAADAGMGVSAGGAPIGLSIATVFIVGLLSALLYAMSTAPEQPPAAFFYIFAGVFISLGVWAVLVTVMMWIKAMKAGHPLGKFLLPAQYLEIRDSHLFVYPLADLTDCKVLRNPIAQYGFASVSLTFSDGAGLIQGRGFGLDLEQRIQEAAAKARDASEKKDQEALSASDPFFDLPQHVARSFELEDQEDAPTGVELMKRAALISLVLGSLVSIPISWVLLAHHTALETARRDQEIKKAVQEHRADELGDIMKYHPETPAALEAGKALVAMRQSALETLTCSPKVRGFVQSRLQSLANGQVLKPIRVRVVPPPASEIEELARRLRATDKENLLAQLDDASLVDVLRSELEERVPDSAIQDGWKRAALSDVMQLTRGERVGESQLPREVSEPTLFISYNSVKSKPAAKLAFHVVLRVPGSPDVVDLNTKVEMPWTDVEARRRRVEQSGRPSIAVSDVVADVYIRLKGQLEEAFCLRGK